MGLDEGRAFVTEFELCGVIYNLLLLHLIISYIAPNAPQARGNPCIPLNDLILLVSAYIPPHLLPRALNSLHLLKTIQSGGKMMHLRIRPSLGDGCDASRALGDPLKSRNTDDENNGNDGRSSSSRTSSLLRTPIAELMSRVTERRVIERSLATAAIEAAASASATRNENEPLENDHGKKDDDNDEEEEEERENGAREPAGGAGGAGAGKGKRAGAAGGGALWVDKYAPEGFRDLLSDEKINREVLRAVKAWDPFVFKKEVRRRGVTIAMVGAGVGGLCSKFTKWWLSARHTGGPRTPTHTIIHRVCVFFFFFCELRDTE